MHKIIWSEATLSDVVAAQLKLQGEPMQDVEPGSILNKHVLRYDFTKYPVVPEYLVHTDAGWKPYTPAEMITGGVKFNQKFGI
jgi:hypothetical protein